MHTSTPTTEPKMKPAPKKLKALYFAYGSNLNVEQFFRRCPNAKRWGPCTLPNYELFFDRVADIRPAKGGAVEGALYEITDRCEAALDRYEGFPHLYGKATFRIEYKVKGETRSREVMVYTMESAVVSPPSPGYVETIREGFDDWGIPHDTLDAAVAQACPPAKTRRRK